MRARPVVLVALLAFGCASSVPMSPKIAFSLAGVNGDGLRGPADGLRAVHYEYCVPAADRFVEEVHAIDPTSHAMKGSRGRIGCRDGQWLMLGDTRQQDYRQVLNRLAGLPYVERIAETFFE